MSCEESFKESLSCCVAALSGLWPNFLSQLQMDNYTSLFQKSLGNFDHCLRRFLVFCGHLSHFVPIDDFCSLLLTMD